MKTARQSFVRYIRNTFNDFDENFHGMDQVYPEGSTTIRGIRNHDIAVIFIVFVIMVGILPIMKTLWFVDVFILNLLHSVDHFYTVKDWKKCSKDLCFGVLYLLTTRVEHIGITLLCGAGVVMAWIGTCRTDGYPCMDWIFFPCVLMYASRLIIPWAPEAVVSVAVFKTAWVFMFDYPRKTLEDILLVFSYMSLHLVFVKEEYNIHFLALSYGFSFGWMVLKS